MGVIVGWLIVIVAMVAGFLIAGGRLGSLFVISEYLIIIGIALGYFVASAPAPLMKAAIGKVLGALKGQTYSKQDFLDLVCVLYEVLLVAREKGIVGIEEHVSQPEQSTLFQKYPRVLNRPHVVEFLQEAFKPVIAGKVKPDQMHEILERKFARLAHHNALPAMLLHKVGDALPGIGIVAAVLGIIVTMGALGGPKEQIGVKVAHALVGTFLGLLLSYGFVQPLAIKIELLNEVEADYFRVAGAIIVSYASGAAPIAAADAGREFIPHEHHVGADDLEKKLKELNKR